MWIEIGADMWPLYAPDRDHPWFVKTLVEHTPKDHFSYQPLLHMILEANTIKV